jgi:hypothetical protein
MNFQFGSIKLSDGAIDPVVGISINGAQINDEFQLVRALATKFVPRGNRSTSIGFAVERSFNTERAAQRFVLEHFSLLPEQASLFITIGAVGDTEVVELADAVVDAVPRSFRGTSVTIQYNFRAGLPSFGVSPPGYTEPDASMIQRKVTAIDSGVDTVAVTFDTPFGSTPVVAVSMQSPASGAAIFAWVRDGSVSTTGFTADLSGATPGAGYKLSWIASA